MSKFNYYASIGSNSLAIFTSWSKYQAASRKFMKNSTCKGFENFYDAEGWALLQLEERFPFVPSPDLMLPDWIYYFKKLMKAEY